MKKKVEKKELYIAMGERLKRYREERNWTQETMAEILEISLTYYGRVERGFNGLSLEKLILAKEKLEIDLTYLLTGEKQAVFNIDLIVEQCPKAKQHDMNQLIQYALKLAK